MNVLITGAFGTVGLEILKKIDYSQHSVTCFDIQNKKTKKRTKKIKNRVKIIWGDIRNKAHIKEALFEIDIVIHLAFKLPPITEDNRELAEAINIGGTRNLIEASLEKKSPPKIIFASSTVIYGDTRKAKQPIAITNKYNPVGPYAEQKVHCMKMLQKSKITHSIFVLGVIPPLTGLGIDPMIYDVPIDSKIELLHIEDTGLAFVNALENNSIWNKIWHIGGGKNCRLEYKEFIQKSLKAMGIGALPESIFGGSLYHTSWLSSEESNIVLDYQRNSFEDILEDMKNNNKILVFLAKIFRGFVKAYLVRKSPYSQKKRKRMN